MKYLSSQAAKTAGKKPRELVRPKKHTEAIQIYEKEKKDILNRPENE